MNDSFSFGELDLEIGEDTRIYINGVVSDMDSWQDIESVSAVFYRSSKSIKKRKSKNNDKKGWCKNAKKKSCLEVEECNLREGESEDEAEFSCALSLPYYLESTDVAGAFDKDKWNVYLEAEDGKEVVSDETASIEVPSTMGVNVQTQQISFGVLDLGHRSTPETNQEMVIASEGNTTVNIEVLVSDMTCSGIGTIPAENLTWSLTDNGADAVSVLPDSIVIDPPLDANTAPSQEYLYWNIEVPESGIRGDCIGNVTINMLHSDEQATIEEEVIEEEVVEEVVIEEGLVEEEEGETSNEDQNEEVIVEEEERREEEEVVEEEEEADSDQHVNPRKNRKRR